MASKLPIIYEASITAQASAAITAGADSAGALTTIDNSKTGNGGGCYAYKCFVNVTVAPSGGAAVARVKYAGISTGTPTKFDSGSIGVEIPNGATGEFEIGDMISPAQYSQIKLAAEDYGFTGSLIAVPMMPEGQ
jgi:hypothetical protein